ncbi:MAG: zinc-ribbon domain-containing protein [Oscillospiraceae bacterium]|nr:zinc-ribbon domain-containing protein [Oscillospiraceae bacterium]
MFCEKCGTQIDDGQPFCPNCGNRLSTPATPESAAAPAAIPTPAASAAPVNPGMSGSISTAPAYTPASPGKAGLKLPSFGGLFDKFNAMQGMKQIYYGCTFLLLVLCFVFSLLKVYAQGGSFSMASGASWLFLISNILFTVCIGLFLLDYFDKYSCKFLDLLIAGSAALILVLFIITWIAGVSVLGFTSSVHLTVGGWFFLIFQAGLTAVSILYILEKKKN